MLQDVLVATYSASTHPTAPTHQKPNQQPRRGSLHLAYDWEYLLCDASDTLYYDLWPAEVETNPIVPCLYRPIGGICAHAEMNLCLISGKKCIRA